MRLNRLEFALVNNPLRAVVQRRFEAARLLRLGGPMDGGTALEIGCGRGFGVKIILDLFGASFVDAFDFDPRMVHLARQQLRPRGEHARLWVGSATEIPTRNSTYDAVFDFGVLHHIPDWRGALAEVHRVMKPGGRFYAEEVPSAFLNHPIVRRCFDHPRNDRFDAREFLDGLSKCGLTPLGSDQWCRCFAWFIATKPPHE